MESYFAAKVRLFEEFDVGVPIVVVDDAWGVRLAEQLPGAVTVSLDGPAAWQAEDIRAGLGGSTFTVRSPAGDAEVALPLRGRFNVANALVAMACAHELGVALDAMVRGARATAAAVPGRVQAVEAGQKLRAARRLRAQAGRAGEGPARPRARWPPGRVIVVFGAGGDRDRAKRPLMGEIAARLADRVVVTSDNPRSEMPEAIIDEISPGSPTGARARRARSPTAAPPSAARSRSPSRATSS